MGKLKNIIQKMPRIFFLVVLIPCLLSAVYLFLLAENQYISKSKLIIKQEKESASIPSNLAILQNFSTSGFQNALLLKEYILSQDMLTSLDKKLDLKAKYKSHKIDFISCLWSKRKEKFLDFYRARVNLFIDETSGVITLDYRDENSKFAQKVLKEIIKQGEEFINEISYNLTSHQLEFVNTEHEKLRDELAIAEEELKAFQNKHQFLTPDRESGSISTIISRLESELAVKEIELKRLRAYLTDKSFEVKDLQNSVYALKRKINSEKSKLANNSGNTKISDLSLQFENLKLNVELLREAYKMSLANLQATRTQSLKKVNFLVTIEQPTLPELSEYPKRFYSMSVIFILSMLLVGIARLGIAFVREHQD